MKFKGLGVAMITPFTKRQKVDFDAIEKIVEHLLIQKIDFLVLLGTTSESATLSKEEKREIIDCAKKKVNGRVPILAGFGSNNTTRLIKDIFDFDFDGIDGILSVCPYYNKPRQKGLYEHFRRIAKYSPLPLVLYNVPGRTSSNLEAETVLKLAKENENIIAIKEASAHFDQIMDIIINKDKDFTVLSGDDALTLPLMSLGMEGVISVTANAFPHDFGEMLRAIKRNETEKARQIHYRLLPIIRLLFSEGNPAGIKAMMQIMGFCEDVLRLPLVKISNSHKKKLQLLYESMHA
jgi:4-hydroxy-tetrahydrodipicolinate synthase